jgi:putative heme-binding domain-containing protein
MEQGEVSRNVLTAFDVRQLLATENTKVTARLQKVWGAIGTASGDKQKRIAQYKSKLNSDVLSNADRIHGRQVFSKTCAACHQLFDDGGKLAPNLTGSQRTNLDYLLENLLDPNAIVGRDFQATTIVTDQGRVITGLVQREDEQAVTLQTPTDTLVIPKAEIEIRKESRQSIMPEEILEKLSDDEIRDLFAYLMGAEQVPLPSE